MESGASAAPPPRLRSGDSAAPPPPPPGLCCRGLRFGRARRRGRRTFSRRSRGGAPGRPRYGARCRKTRPAPLPETGASEGRPGGRAAGRRREPLVRCKPEQPPQPARAASRRALGGGGGPESRGLAFSGCGREGGLYGRRAEQRRSSGLEGLGSHRAARTVAQAEVQRPGSSAGGREADRRFSACEQLTIPSRDGRLLGGVGGGKLLHPPRGAFRVFIPHAPKRKAAERKGPGGI